MRDQKMCISKQTTFVISLFLLLLGYVFFAYLTMKNSASINSRASDTKKSFQSVPFAGPPTELQQNSALIYKVSRNNSGDIELLGTHPRIIGSPKYAIYMKKTNGSFVHIDTFIASNDELKNRFTSFWSPQTTISIEDVKTSEFLLYEVK